MNLATWSIRNPIPTILVFFFLTLAGSWGFKQTNIQSMPDLDLPRINVTLTQPGAAPAQLETEVARIVEGAISSLENLKNLRTSITDGQISMSVEFTISTDTSEALTNVKDAIDRVRNQLPTDLEDPQVSKNTLGPGGALATYALANDSIDEEALSWFVDDTVEQAIRSIPGIGSFERLGGVQREIHISIDPIRSAALGVTATDISRALRNTHQDSSGGLARLAKLQQGVRTLANVKHPDDLKALPIALPNGSFLRLDQVADVEDTIAERTLAARLNGQPAVGFKILRTKGADEKNTAAEITRVMHELQQQHPQLKVQLVSTSVTNTLEDYEGSMSMLIEGGLLAIFVIWWFLRDWRTTVIGAVALPLSILPTFAAMYWMDFTLSSITLLALSVVVGILVDDAVVEVENISRHMQMGKTVREATIEAVNEIAVAVLGTTATLIAVFLPTALMGGVSGLIFQQFGWTIVAAVMASLLVARMVTPVMAIWMLKPTKSYQRESKIMMNYMRCAKWCIHHRKTTILSGTLFFLGSLALIPLIPTSFMPAEDNGIITINIELAPGSNLDRSLATAETIYDSLKDIEGIESVFTAIGSSTQGSMTSQNSGQIRKGTITLTLQERSKRQNQQEMEKIIQKRLLNIPGVRTSFTSESPGEKIQILLVSNDNKSLITSAHAIETDLRGLPFMSGINSSASLDRSEITVRPRLDEAAEQGVSSYAIGETLRIALAGDFDPSLAKLNLDRRQINIRVKMPLSFRQDLQAIQQLQVHGRNGLIPLSSIADISIENGPSQINRHNRQRQVTINADLGGYPIGNAVEARDKLPSVVALPSNVKMIEAGDAEIMNEMIESFGGALVLGLLLTYAVLVVLFSDWFQPFTILSAIPLSMGGAFISVLLAGHSLGLPVMIGLIMLMGIVTKNSILLVDFALLARREQNMTLIEAITDACHKRARPIVMTTVAMLAGLTPLAMGFGGGASLRQPMAIAVMGGLFTSTALSLLVVPVVFIYITRLQNWLTLHISGPRKDIIKDADLPKPVVISSQPTGDNV